MADRRQRQSQKDAVRDPICTDGVERLRLRVHGPEQGAETLIYLPGIHGDWTLIGPFRREILPRVRFVEMSYPRNETWSLPDYAEAIEMALASAGIRGGWLLGESFGSQVLWELVARGRIDLRGLILAGGFVRYPTPVLLAAAGWIFPRVSHRMLHRVLPAYQMYAHLRFRKDPEAIQGAREFIARRTAEDQRAAVRRLRVIAENDPGATAARTRIPVHHLYGAWDPIVPWPWVARWLRDHCPALRGSRRLWNADHTVLATAAADSAEQVRVWMS